MFDNEFPPLGGGTGIVNYHLLKFFNTIPDVWVDLVTASRSRCGVENEKFGDRISIHRVPVNNKNIHHASNRELLAYTYRALTHSRRLLRRQYYDLSFAFSTVPAGAISYALQTTAKLPYLVSLQGPDVPGFEARYDYLYPFLKPVIKRIWSRAAIVTATSQYHQQLANSTLPGLKVSVVFNGVDATVFRPSDEHSEADGINILCVGRLIERKGQEYLLRAFARLRPKLKVPSKLTLVGTGDTEASLRSLTEDLLIVDNVDFVGAVSGEKMPKVFKKGDIFVLPSQNEGMSIALLEAMACGLPVVVTNTGGTAELVQENVNGFVVPWADIQALTEHLFLLVKDRQLRQRFGEASRQTAMKFSWIAMSQRYLELCFQIAQGTVAAVGSGARRIF